ESGLGGTAVGPFLLLLIGDSRNLGDHECFTLGGSGMEYCFTQGDPEMTYCTSSVILSRSCIQRSHKTS
ncbi:MAG: hypothetical protein ACHQ0J_06780, partial [Candidatus Dormibacterales bacterium]